MKQKLKLLVLFLFPILLISWMLYYAGGQNIDILNSKGEIANHQRNILIFTALLSLIVIIPVFTMLGLFVWRYRESNKKATYRPDWGHNNLLEVIWWGIPILIIVVLSVVTWKTSHSLDPWRPLDSEKEPVRVQVVALQWKWLFIYPDHNIATINYFRMPVDTPVNFEIAADAPMNSFWIPSLGGQIYAMNGMITKLHLQADEPGQYDGVSANISGEGFADMKFIAEATSQNEFDHWIHNIKNENSENLSIANYTELALPSSEIIISKYGSADPELFNYIVMKYMPEHGNHKEHTNNSSPQIDHSHHEGHGEHHAR